MGGLNSEKKRGIYIPELSLVEGGGKDRTHVCTRKGKDTSCLYERADKIVFEELRSGNKCLCPTADIKSNKRGHKSE